MTYLHCYKRSAGSRHLEQICALKQQDCGRAYLSTALSSLLRWCTRFLDILTPQTQCCSLKTWICLQVKEGYIYLQPEKCNKCTLLLRVFFSCIYSIDNNFICIEPFIVGLQITLLYNNSLVFQAISSSPVHAPVLRIFALRQNSRQS